jgi:fibronectin-binding autotransporter adhesin
LQDSELIRAAILDRLARSEATPATTGADTGAPAATGAALAPSFWMQAMGDDGHVKSDGNAATLSRSTGGFLLGGDVGGLELLGGEARLGGAGGYLHDNLDIPDRSATATAEQVFAALYGASSFGPVVVSLGGA